MPAADDQFGLKIADVASISEVPIPMGIEFMDSNGLASEDCH
jgi:hypothetical protein